MSKAAGNTGVMHGHATRSIAREIAAIAFAPDSVRARQGKSSHVGAADAHDTDHVMALAR
jgi:hypothetical protein